jgi:hypothetical protein
MQIIQSPTLVAVKIQTIIDKDAASSLWPAIERVLAYFEVFQYPLSVAEIQQYLNATDGSTAHVERALQLAAEQGRLFEYGGWYQRKPQPDWAERRMQLNTAATNMLPRALRMGRLIGYFPYVRAVMISGSMSKHCLPSDGDVDFFIITAPGRLWMARTTLILFKKIFLLNSHKYFCINYLVDTDHLEIEDKNQFTATETVTLLPVVGPEYCAQFNMANHWAWEQFYPNFTPRSVAQATKLPRSLLKSTIEWCCNSRFGDYLDRIAMQFTVGFWRKKFSHFSKEEFELSLRSRRYVSKHHPTGFQNKVLNKWLTLLEK